MHKVIWSKSVLQDLENILDYIQSKQSTETRAIASGILSSIRKLSEFPDSGHHCPELAFQGIYAYREIIHQRWRIIYRHVMHNSKSYQLRIKFIEV